MNSQLKMKLLDIIIVIFVILTILSPLLGVLIGEFDAIIFIGLLSIVMFLNGIRNTKKLGPAFHFVAYFLLCIIIIIEALR